MLGHGERLAVAIVAVAALDVNVVLIALVYGQPGDCERLALLAGMRCSINFLKLVVQSFSDSLNSSHQ